MKKLATILAAALIAVSAIVPASAKGAEKFTVGNGYLIDGKNSAVKVEETDKGLQLTYGGYYVDGKNWSGVASVDKYTIDGFSVEMTLDKLPNTDSDTWFCVGMLSKPQLFQVGDYASNKGISNLIRWGRSNIENYGPEGWNKNEVGDTKTDKVDFKAGDKLTVSFKLKDGKYFITVNGVESAKGYSTAWAADGKAHFVFSSSMKNSPEDGFVTTITKINGQPVVTKEVPKAEETSDLSIAVAAIALASLAGAVVVSKKRSK